MSRIYYAIEQFSIAADGSTYRAIKGAQTVSFSTDNPLTQIFQLGRLDVYGTISDLPTINLTAEKYLDGYPLIYHEASRLAATPDLNGRTVKRCSLGLSVFDNSQTSASGDPNCMIEISGADISSVSYTFSVDGVHRESVGFAGNDIIVSSDDQIVNSVAAARAAALDIPGTMTGTFTPFLSQKEHILYDPTIVTLDINNSVEDPDVTVLPQDIAGIDASGVNVETSGVLAALIQNITVSVDLNRTEIKALGSKAVQYRYVEYPVEVTTEIETIPNTCAIRSATAEGVLNDGDRCDANYGKNIKDRTIRIATCEGTRVYTGLKNQLRSQNWSGGDAEGGNVTVSYSYVTYNDFTVLHENDPNSNGATWWTNRADYLVG